MLLFTVNLSAGLNLWNFPVVSLTSVLELVISDHAKGPASSMCDLLLIDFN